MLTRSMSSPEGPRPYENWRVACLGLLAVLILVPVTMPVTVLRAFVQERFGVSEFMTSLFMSVNMVGAVLSAPIAGALADRFLRGIDHLKLTRKCKCHFCHHIFIK